MMFFHKRCQHEVYSDLSPHIKIVTVFGIGITSTKPGQGELIFPKAKKLPAHYFCPACEENVKVTDLYGKCQYCGENFDAASLFRCVENKRPTSGIGCKNCLDAVEKGLNITTKRIPLDNILEYIYFDVNKSESY
jgi:hypothetical protein